MKTYKIGVDGGGTKTECMLIDDTGRMVAGHVGVGCNPSVVGTAQATSIILAALNSLRAQAAADAAEGDGGPVSSDGLITATLLCMAGHRDFWSDLARKLAGFGRVETPGDFLPVLELATGGQPGLVLHAGTGSFVAARTADGATHFAGGLGWRFGDPGSGYDLGRIAIARGLLELQGWAPPSRLGPTVREHAGLEAGTHPSLITRHYYQHPEPNRPIAALAPVVLRLAAEGDAASREIAISSAGELLDLAVRMATKLYSASLVSSVKAGLSGPLLNHPVVHEALAARAPFALIPITETPIEGVRRLLARM